MRPDAEVNLKKLKKELKNKVKKIKNENGIQFFIIYFNEEKEFTHKEKAML